MGLESGTYISDLVAANPLTTDPKSQGDDHIRLLKTTIKATFPNVTGAVTPTQAQLNVLAGLGSGVATFLATPSSANLASAVTGESGSGALLFGTSPAIITPTITSTREVVSAMGANAIDLSLGNFFTKTVAGNITLSLSNVPSTGTAISFMLELTNGGAYTITWWANLNWQSGTPPTLTASGRDALAFWTHNGGTTWNGVVVGTNMA